MPYTQVADANYASLNNGRGIELTAVRDGLVGEFLFGRDEATTVVNSAGARSPASIIRTGGAAPGYGDHQAIIGNGTAIGTGIIASAAQTVMVVMAPGVAATLPANASGDHIIMGADNDQNGQPFMTLDASGSGRMTVTPINAGPTIFMPAGPTAPLTDFRAICFTIAGLASGSPFSLTEYKAGAQAQTTSGVLSDARPTPAYQITLGNSPSTAAGGPFQARLPYAAALIWSRDLSADQRLAAYRSLRTQLAGMGKSA